ncbi:uncharacterized protein LOC126907493 isoform X2 [Daktulosphaira vitifoliae]|uniref:uncharacterized protein LOC126907493 isoform X2 n=1 Tax=Daktulosphaira vitifoliae TaxID=58002 RepID=UPI0021A9F681|nr:uncharacterized protein LOC126907493 isoform X2 [Daktulosphaira vitifoliae]
MANENNTESHIYETNMNVVKRRIEELWNRRFMSSNLVVDCSEEPQKSKKSEANSGGNINPETNSVKPKKRNYRKQIESDEIIAEKVKLIQRGDIATLIKNEKSGKYKEKLSVPAKKSYIPILNDKAPSIPAYLLGKSFHKNHLHRNKCEEKKQPVEVSSNDTGRLYIESNLSEEHDEVIKKLEANNEPSITSNDVTLPDVSTDKIKETPEEKIINLQPTKCGIKEQLLELSGNTVVRPNLKRNSSEKDEKVIKKPKVSSEVSASNTNDVNIPAVSVVEIDEIPEKEIGEDWLCYNF